MRPIRYSIVGNKTIFHYKTSEIREFYRRGKEHGDVGMIVVTRAGNIITRKGFGTIENPRTTIYTISLVHHPLFDDGPMLTDDERIAPRERSKELFGEGTSSEWVVIDLSELVGGNSPTPDY